MRHHEDGLVAARKEIFQPDDHLEVEVVGGFVEYQEVGIGNQHLRQCHTFLLSAGELVYGLLHVGDAQLRKNLFCLKASVIVRINPRETRLQHSGIFRKTWLLTQETRADAIAIDDGAGVGSIVTRQQGKECRFACSILSNQTNALTLGNGKRDVLEKNTLSKTFRKILDIKNRCCQLFLQYN